MFKKECLLFGSIYKLHGFKGEVNIYNEFNINIDLANIEYLFVEIDKQLIPFFIENIKNIKTKVVLVKFLDLDSENKSLKLIKNKVYVPKKWIIESVNKHKEKNIIGYKVIDKQIGSLGIINSIKFNPVQNLIYVQNKNKEFCIPMHEEFIKIINHRQKEIIVKVTNEIIDLN